MCSVAGCVRLQDVLGCKMCSDAGCVWLQDVNGCRMCSFTWCVMLQDVFGYMMCSVTGCVRLHDVFGYRMCLVAGCIRLQDWFGYRMCSVTGCVWLQGARTRMTTRTRRVTATTRFCVAISRRWHAPRAPRATPSWASAVQWRAAWQVTRGYTQHPELHPAEPVTGSLTATPTCSTLGAGN